MTEQVTTTNPKVLHLLAKCEGANLHVAEFSMVKTPGGITVLNYVKCTFTSRMFQFSIKILELSFSFFNFC